MIFLIFALYLLIRLYPYFLLPVPLGYDPGLYLYLWKQYQSISLFKFTSLPKWLVEVYPPFLPFIGKIISFVISPDHFLIPLSFVIAALLFLSIYLYSKNFWIMFLLAISAIQYKFWWWFYIKNILATSFIFFYLYFDKQKSKWKWIFIPLIVLTHQPTAIIFFLILIFKRKLKPILLFLLAFALYYLPNYQLTIKPFLQATVSTVGQESGTFYSLSESLRLMWVYLPLTFYGIYLSIKKRTNKMEIFLLVISFLIPLFGLFLSQRFIPFFDLFALILAGYGASIFFAKHKKIALLYSLLLLVFVGTYVYKNSAAKINNDEYQEIKLMSETEADAYILVVDNEYTPWIYGWSDRKTIAPGFGEYDNYWTYEQWDSFWQSDNRATELELLKKLPGPLYLYFGDKQRLSVKAKPEGDCFERYSWHTFKFLCGNKDNL